MVVSIPEKTLEHWASIYLTYRYHSHASLWWPAHGEDINVGNLPPTAGKAVQLEMKTTYLNKKGDVHQVKISLKQLDRYLKRPHGKRPFYVFPRPHWTGELEVAAPADCLPATEVGFRRADYAYPSTSTWWFAEWLVVLTTDQVKAIVATDLASYQAGTWVAKSDSVMLVTFDLKSGKPLTTWADGTRHRTIPWLKLWPRLDECGAAAWHQLVRMPTSVLGRRRTVQHKDIRGLLAESIHADGELITMTSGEDGLYRPLPDEPDPRESTEASDDQDHRIMAFLGVDALRAN